MSAVQVLREADALKTAAADTSKGANEAWVSRQALQDLYQRVLILDLELALDKKVEQDLWNHAFKNQINALQGQVKDKNNPKRTEVQASLNLFLETASGFYLQLLQELCSAFKLDLPFRRKPETLGILKECGPIESKLRMPKKASCMYIAQHCLVHLGDIARYRQQADQAQTYYRHAAGLVPYNGQPYNQLAILEAAKGNKLATVFYYVQSIAVKYPFPVAATNLEKFFTKISKDTFDVRPKMFLNEFVNTFLQHHAFIYLGSDLGRARQQSARLTATLSSHITAALALSAHQLLQIVVITLFALGRASRSPKPSAPTDLGGDAGGNGGHGAAYDILVEFVASLLDVLLACTPKTDLKAPDFLTMPALKTLLDWLRLQPQLWAHKLFSGLTIWQNMSKLLNNIQFCSVNMHNAAAELQKHESVPLPEESQLQCFLPVQAAYSELNFHLMMPGGLAADLECSLRCLRIIKHGQWICDEYPSLLAMQTLKNGKIQFMVAIPHLKLLGGAKTTEVTMADKKPAQQNTVVQAIMQKHAQRGAETKSLSPDGSTSTNGSNLRSGSNRMIRSPYQSQDVPSVAPPGGRVSVHLESDSSSCSVSPDVRLSLSPSRPAELWNEPVGGAGDVGGAVRAVEAAQQAGQDQREAARLPPLTYGGLLTPQEQLLLQLQQQRPSQLLQQQLLQSPQQGLFLSSLPPRVPPPPPPTYPSTPPRSIDITVLPPARFTPPQPPYMSPYVVRPAASPPCYPYAHPVHSPSSPAGPPFLSAPSSPNAGLLPFGQSLPIAVPTAAAPGGDLYTSSPIAMPRQRAVGQRGSGSLQSPLMGPRHAYINVDEPDTQDILHCDSPTSFLNIDARALHFAESGSSCELQQPAYSLFSESPWTVQINKQDATSHGSSPFGSSSSSLRTTPDPMTGDDHVIGAKTGGGGGVPASFGLAGYGFCGADGAWGSAGAAHANAAAPDTVDILASNIQTLWSSGPSPLEKLIEQQKQQRHGDPR